MDYKMKRMPRSAERSRSMSVSPDRKRSRSSSSCGQSDEDSRREVIVIKDRSHDSDSRGRHSSGERKYDDRDRSKDKDNRYRWERRDERDRSEEKDNRDRLERRDDTDRSEDKDHRDRWERRVDRNKRDYRERRDNRDRRNDRDRSEDRDRASDDKPREVQYRRNWERRDDQFRKYDRDLSDDRSRRDDSRVKRNERREPRNEDDTENGKSNRIQKKTANNVESLTTRTGGAYIPPAKLRMLQSQIADKSSAEYQRISWEALKKSIHGLINKINTNNIGIIVREMFRENVVRGRGLLARSIMQAQAFSPTFTHVYAALTSIINSKFPETGELILRRLIVLFRRSYRRNDKQLCMTSARFIGHLVNQQVAHELVALEILTLLLENPTDDSVEVAIGFLKECGMKLSEVTPKGIHSIFDRLRSILHEGQLDKRVQYMIEVMFAIRKDGFKDHPSVVSELDLVEENDQYTHMITLEDATNPDDILNVFKYDPEYQVNEEKYALIRKEILDESSSGSEDGSSGSESEDEEDAEEREGENQEIIDSTETNLVALRRTIYLTIQSSLDFEECAHKLLKLELKPGEIIELCHMILDCCAQQRTYEKFYGLLAQRFCQLNKVYVEPYQEIFKSAYDTIHRFETNKLRNVGKFFAHLLYTDAISWLVLSNIRLNEDDTTSSSRIFIKILFQELCEYMGLPKLNNRVKDVTLQEAFDGIFPRDNPRNTRFAINFFTSIGLGGLTDDLREHLKNAPKPTPVPLVNLGNPSSSSDSEESVVEVPKQKKAKHKQKKAKKQKHSKKRRQDSTVNA